MNDQFYIKKTVELAKKSYGLNLPNPNVGAILVKDQKIIGQGFHKSYGHEHAEVNAINDALKVTKDLSGTTLYVSLSPCTRHGKTPPCSDLIIKHKISKVVYGFEDATDVSAKEILEKANIEVINTNSKEAKELIKPFLKYKLTKKPFIVGKAAITLDSKIATSTGDSKWITSSGARDFANKRRSLYQAIIVGANTIKLDNPNLNVRHSGYAQPTIIIIDNQAVLKPELNIFNNSSKKIVITNQKYNEKDFNNTSFEYFSEELIKVEYINELLIKHNLFSALIEGGSYTFNSFLKAGLVDKLELYIAPKLIGDINALSAFNYKEIKLMKDTDNYQITSLEIVDKDIFLELEKKCLQE